MSLADQVAQAREPYIARQNKTLAISVLNNTADNAQDVTRCPLRFVLTDELVRLCTALAFSRGARTIQCADLLHIPATSLWIEWCTAPWENELASYGFPSDPGTSPNGRRGVLLRSTSDGRRGIVRSFWSDVAELEPLASSVEAYFDFDVSAGDEPEPIDREAFPILRVVDEVHRGKDVMSQCFRFRYERSWREYYDRAALSPSERTRLDRHALGTIAVMIPTVLAFLLLLGTRSSLPRRIEPLTRLNASRAKAGKPPLLEHVEVGCPVIPTFPTGESAHRQDIRRGPRLHHVRGHLVRRGSDLYWRIPHLRGNARAGKVMSRTVTWTLEPRAR